MMENEGLLDIRRKGRTIHPEKKDVHVKFNFKWYITLTVWYDSYALKYVYIYIYLFSTGRQANVNKGEWLSYEMDDPRFESRQWQEIFVSPKRPSQLRGPRSFLLNSIQF